MCNEEDYEGGLADSYIGSTLLEEANEQLIRRLEKIEKQNKILKNALVALLSDDREKNMIIFGALKYTMDKD